MECLQMVDYFSNLKRPAYLNFKLSFKSSIEITLKIEAMRNFEIKIALEVGHWDESDWMQRVSEDPKLRETFIENVMDLVKEFQMDAVFLYWTFPGCPKVKNFASDSPIMKNQTIIRGFVI